MSTLEIVAWIVIPICIFICGVGAASVKGIIRFAQYLAHSEESLDKVAESNQRISERLGEYIKQTDDRLNLHEKRLSWAEFKLGKE